MSDQVMIVLIVALAVVIVLVVFRDKLSRFVFKAKGINAHLETHTNSGVKISKTSQKGKGHEINVERDNVDISDHKQDGEDHKLTVKKNKS